LGVFAGKRHPGSLVNFGQAQADCSAKNIASLKGDQFRLLMSSVS